MATKFTDPKDIEGMRVAGKLAAQLLNHLDQFVLPGRTTDELDIEARLFIEENNAIAAPLGYTAGGNLPPFPKAICTSVNHVVCHGIPGNKVLKKGDFLNIDVTVIVDGYYGDTSKMYFVGKPPTHLQRLAKVTQECLYKGIEQVKAGALYNDIGRVIEQHAHAHNYSVVREFCGHGIGKVFHAPPQVVHYDIPGRTERMEVGQCFTIEPMINQGKRDVRVLGDQWTCVTKDRRPSAQYEHTLMVTEQGCEVFTVRDELSELRLI